MSAVYIVQITHKGSNFINLKCECYEQRIESVFLPEKGKQIRKKCCQGENVIYPIIGKIIIGNSIAQFSTKLKIEERLWHVKSGRATGKSHTAVKLNREINFINLTIHAHYADILKRTGAVTAIEVKNAFQGIASSQKTLLVLFEEVMTVSGKNRY